MRFSRKILLFLLLLPGLSCQAPVRIAATLTPPQPVLTSAATLDAIKPTPTFPATGPQSPQTTIQPGAPTLANAACAVYSPLTAGLLEKTSPEQWLDWIEKLSGAEPVMIGGVETRITT
ncbi:MAG: hypothetical protein IH586_08780, partial [Anaerolineaceae bacterium]|nr:hypothetical protein [Anaerolineaceae bacterium]